MKHGLAGHRLASALRLHDALCCWPAGPAARLLAGASRAALEIPCRGHRRFAACAAADGAGLLRADGDRPAQSVGRTCESLVGHRLPFTFQGLLVASVLYSLPLPCNRSPAALRRRPTDGGSLVVSRRRRSRDLFPVALPLAWPGVLTGMVLSFAHTWASSAWC